MRRVHALLLIAALVGGCAGPAATSGQPSLAAQPTPAATASRAPSRSPQPTPTPIASIRQIELAAPGWAMTLVGDALWVQVDAPTDALVRIDITTGAIVPVVPGAHRARAGDFGIWTWGQDFRVRLDPVTGRELVRIDSGGQLAAGTDGLWALSDGMLERLDPLTGAVEATLEIDGSACGQKDLAVGFGSAWLTCKGGSVDRVDLATGALVRIETSEGSHTPLVTSDAVWVTNYIANTTSRIDPATNAVLTKADIGGGIGITEGGGFVWVAADRELVALNPTGTVIRRVAAPAARYLYDLVWTEEGIWASSAGRLLYLIDVS
jgi:hypothetical protein